MIPIRLFSKFLPNDLILYRGYHAIIIQPMHKIIKNAPKHTFQLLLRQSLVIVNNCHYSHFILLQGHYPNLHSLLQQREPLLTNINYIKNNWHLLKQNLPNQTKQILLHKAGTIFNQFKTINNITNDNTALTQLYDILFKVTDKQSIKNFNQIIAINTDYKQMKFLLNFINSYETNEDSFINIDDDTKQL